MSKFHLGWFLGPGTTIQGWNEPGFPHGYDWTKPALFQDAARALERAFFDVFIIEDSSTVPDTYGASMDFYLKNATMTPKFDPAALTPYLAAVTSNLGIVPTLTSTFYPPYLLARLVSTLDHFSSGRIGWNIVTAANDRAGQNYGLPAQPEHDLRYDMADEYIDLVSQLWEAWDADAVVLDEANHVFADPSKVRPINFEGRFYKSRGPLNVPRSPQGKPVFVAPGASPRGRRFSGRNAEIVLAGHAEDVEAMKDYRDEVHRHAREYGRDPAGVKVLFTLSPFVVGSKREAEELKEQQARARHANIERTLASYSYQSGIDFSKMDLDTPLPEIKINGVQSLLRTFANAGPGATLRDIATRVRTFTVIGTPDSIAEELRNVIEEVGGDGFLIAGHIKPRYLLSITEGLVPTLQKRGLTRTEYGGATLRDNLLAF
nr:NtaA/DmoA family FMN-dependent monooxygenase [uncultured Roseococcus sp.]